MHIALPIGGGSRIFAGVTRDGPKYVFLGKERESSGSMGVGLAIFPERSLTGEARTSMRVLVDEGVNGFLPQRMTSGRRKVFTR